MSSPREVLDDRAVSAAAHDVPVICASREAVDANEVDVVSVLAFVHRDQRAQRAANVALHGAEERGHGPLEVGLGFNLVDVGRAHEEPAIAEVSALRSTSGTRR